MEDLRVADVAAAPGETVRHEIDLVELADGLRVRMPIVLINGTRPGPRLYLGAGIHGDEVTTVAVAAALLGRLRVQDLAGGLVCVPVQNPLALHADHRFPVGHYLRSPLDQSPIDPWSSFPGNPDGSFAERLANRLLELITGCDYAIDMHTPTRGGRYVPITILPPARLGAAAKRAEEFGLAFGSGYVMKTDQGMYVRDGILCVEATRRGVPTFTFETGEGGRLEPNLVADGVRCVLNALRHLGMLPGELAAPPRIVRMSDFAGVRSTHGGLLYTDVPLGEMVKQGQRLARIVSVWGDELEAIIAPVDGLFVRATTLATVTAGERVITVAPVQ
jgi:predicted deacylase